MMHLGVIQVVLLSLQYILINCNNECFTTQDSQENQKGQESFKKGHAMKLLLHKHKMERLLKADLQGHQIWTHP